MKIFLDAAALGMHVCANVQMKKSRHPAATVKDSCCRLAGLLSPRLFKALGDPKRLSLLVRLAGEGESCTISRVAEGSGVHLSVVSRHLAVLRDAGIIKCEKRGKEVWCTLQAAAIAPLLRDLADAIEACCPAGEAIAVSGPGTASGRKGTGGRSR